MKKTKERVFVLIGAVIAMLLVSVVILKFGENSDEPSPPSQEVAEVVRLDKAPRDSASESRFPVDDEPEEPEADTDAFLNSVLGADPEELMTLGERFGREDPLLGLELAAEAIDRDSEEYEWFYLPLFDAWAEVAPVEAVEYLLSLWNKEGGYQFADFMDIPLKEWARENPLEAANLFPDLIRAGEGDLRKSRNASDMLEAVLEVWSESEPAASLSWVLGQTGFENRERFIGTVIEGWASKDPLAALAQIQLFEGGSADIVAVKDAVLGVWAESDASAAAEWATANLTEAEYSSISVAADKLVEGLFRQYSGDAAVEWLDSLPNESVRESALSNLVYLWSRAEEPVQLLDTFAAKVNAGDSLYASILADAAQKVASRHPVEVAEWLNAQAALDPITDKVSEGFIDAVNDQAPDAAYEWAQSIQNDTLRNRMVYSVLKKWSYSDYRTLDLWLSDHGDQLDPELVAELRETVEDSYSVDSGEGI